MKEYPGKRFFFTFLFCVITAIFFGGVVYAGTKELNVDVAFSDTQIRISNNESFPLTKVRMKINDKYIYEVDKINANSMNTVGMGVFTLKDGTRFNPYQTAIKSLSIYCTEGSTYFTSK